MTDTIELSPPGDRKDAGETKATSQASRRLKRRRQSLSARRWRSPKRRSTRRTTPPQSGSSARYYEHVPPADVAERSPRDLSGRRAVAVAFCRAPPSGPGQDPSLQPRDRGRWLVLSAHDRRDRQRRHAVSRRFGDRGDQRRRPRRPSRGPSDPDRRTRSERPAARDPQGRRRRFARIVDAHRDHP